MEKEQLINRAENWIILGITLFIFFPVYMSSLESLSNKSIQELNLDSLIISIMVGVYILNLILLQGLRPIATIKYLKLLNLVILLSFGSLIPLFIYIPAALQKDASYLNTTIAMVSLKYFPYTINLPTLILMIGYLLYVLNEFAKSGYKNALILAKKVGLVVQP